MTDIDDSEERHERSLSEVIRAGVKAAMDDMRVCLVGTIVDYDHKTQKASVKPSFKRNYNGTVEEMPIIYNVPVAHPRSGDSWIHMPLKKGDRVTLSFCDRSIEKWASNGEVNDPEDVRSHHLSDAIAYPGGYPFSDKADVANGNDIILKNTDGMEIRIKPNGHVQFLNSSNELIKVLYDLITILREARIATGDAGMQPILHWRWAEIQRRLQTFLEG